MGAPVSGAAWTELPLDVVRGLIARTLLPDVDPAARLGEIALWPHQRDAVARLRAAIAEFGGALLADDVGLGKTFVALAIAARYERPLVVAPAAIRTVWRDAAARASVPIDLVSIESLSRFPPRARSPDLVIVDEAHHARNPVTKRHAALACLVANADALLLSATPVHNSRADLVAIFALFLGERARTMSDGALARCIVRRSREQVEGGPTLPHVDGPHPLAVAGDDGAVAQAIVALPPAVPAADAGSAHALLLVMMIRQWSSSAAALRGGIRRRLAVAHSLERTLAGGRHPTRAELAAWTLGDDAQQLAFAELLVPAREEIVRPRTPELRDAIARHVRALDEIRRLVDADPDVDRRRAAALHEVRRAHPGTRLVAFAQFAETIDAYWRELRSVPRVAALTAKGGRVAGGAIPRDEVLAMFAPSARAIPPARRVDAMFTTDLASEGVDLQAASVLVHLDLPWTAARLEQRLGRLRRPGAAAPVVHVYTMEPPARASTIVAIRETLAAKLAAARLVLGRVMPEVGLLPEDDSGERSPIALNEIIRRALHRWLGHPAHAPDGRESLPLVAAARSATGEPGWLALVDGDPSSLVAKLGTVVGDDLVLVGRAVLACEDAEVDMSPAQLTIALAETAKWCEERRAATLAGVSELGAWRSRHHALAGLARSLHSGRSVRQSAVHALQRAHALASGALSAEGERRLEALARAGVDPRAWSEAVAGIAARPGAARAGGEGPSSVRALILLVGG